MKTLSEISNPFESTIEKHMYIEFLFRNSMLNESHGLFDGVEEMAHYIADKLCNTDVNDKTQNLTFSKSDLENAGLKNVFFKYLFISILKLPGAAGASYKVSSISNIDTDEKLMNTCNICVNKSGLKDYKSMYVNMIHELTHAYDDYKSLIKTGKGVEEINRKEGSYKRGVEIANSTSSKITNNHKAFSFWVYRCREVEVKAITASIYADLKKEMPNIKDYKDALNHLKENKDYKRYNEILDTLIAFEWMDLDGKLDNKVKNELTNIYNYIFRTNLTFNKVLKKMTERYIDIMKRIHSNIPKIYYDYVVKTNEGLAPSNFGEDIMWLFEKRGLDL